MHMIISQTSTAMNTRNERFVGNNDATLASPPCFIDDFPLPFQEVSGSEGQQYYAPPPQTQSSYYVPQDNNWRYHQPQGALPFALPLPLPIRSVSASSLSSSSSSSSSSTAVAYQPQPQQDKRKSSSGSRRPKPQPVLSTTTTTSALSYPEGRALPEDFTPRKWSVLIGRDRKSIESPGNQRLHIIIGWYLKRYAKSHDNKDEKSAIISEIEATVRSACGQGERGAFVKYSNGGWWEVETPLVREKISRMLREALHTNYSSSSKQKRARRRLLRRVSCNEE